MYFGHVARADPTSTLFRALFKNENFELRGAVCKQGRPKDTWGRKIMHEAIKMCENKQELAYALSQDNFSSHKAAIDAWKQRVKQYCRTSLVVKMP